MEIRYNVTGAERKALVGAISEILAANAIYKAAPTFAYEVGDCIVDINGALTFFGHVTDEEIMSLVNMLQKRGYHADIPHNTCPDQNVRMAIEVPRRGLSDHAVATLRNIIASKRTLIMKAIGADSLPIEVFGDKLRFPWFTLDGTDEEADAYSRFIAALCAMARKQKRAFAREQVSVNDKFNMRLFLVRLGFIGDGYKAARRILLSKLTGNSSWKYGRPVRSPISKL